MTNKKLNNSEIKFMVFDLDGVLVDTVSSWVWVHNHFGVNNDDSYEKYMKNEIDDNEFMRSDISLWLSKKELLHIDEIRSILSKVPIMPGFSETMEILKYLGVEIAIVSSGLEPLAQRVARLGGIPHFYANGLEIDKNGYLTGEGILQVKLRAKGERVKELESDLGYDSASTAAVGNGETDIPMFQATGLGIAFNPIDKNPVEKADAVVYEKNLTKILQYICDLNELPLELKTMCTSN